MTKASLSPEFLYTGITNLALRLKAAVLGGWQVQRIRRKTEQLSSGTAGEVLFLKTADPVLRNSADRAAKADGQVGVVPILFYRLRLKAEQTVLFTCGPEIMMRFVVFEGLARRIPQERIFLSMERNMKCGQGFCGHCQLGPYFICKEGPVFHFDQLAGFFNVENF